MITPFSRDVGDGFNIRLFTIGKSCSWYYGKGLRSVSKWIPSNLRPKWSVCNEGNTHEDMYFQDTFTPIDSSLADSDICVPQVNRCHSAGQPLFLCRYITSVVFYTFLGVVMSLSFDHFFRSPKSHEIFNCQNAIEKRL